MTTVTQSGACDTTDEVAVGIEQPAPTTINDSPAGVRGCLSKHRYLTLGVLLAVIIAAVLLGVFLGRGDECSTRCFNDWNTLCDCVQKTSGNQVFTLCSGIYHMHNRPLKLPAENNLTFTCETATTGAQESRACVLIPTLKDLDTVFLNAVEGGSNENRILLRHLTFSAEPVDAGVAVIGSSQTYDVIVSGAGRPVDVVDCTFEVSLPFL